MYIWWLQSSHQRLFQEGGWSTEYPCSWTLFPKLRGMFALALFHPYYAQLGVCLMDDFMLLSDFSSDLLLLSSSFYFFNWRIIALQNFVVFCQTSTWLSHRYPYIPSLWTSPFHPSRLIQSPCLSSLRHTANFHWLSVLHIVMYVFMLLSWFVPPFPPLSPQCFKVLLK